MRLRTVEDEDEDDVYICNARERLFSARHGITCSVLVSVASPSWGVKKTLGSVRCMTCGPPTANIRTHLEFGKLKTRRSTSLTLYVYLKADDTRILTLSDSRLPSTKTQFPIKEQSRVI